MAHEKTFIGRREPEPAGAVIYIRDAAGREIPLDPRLDLRRHSPTGFEWGYVGSGPAQAALAICAVVAGDETAQRVYHLVKERVIATIPQESGYWSISESAVRAEIQRSASPQYGPRSSER